MRTARWTVVVGLLVGGCVATVEERPGRFAVVAVAPPAPLAESPPGPAAAGTLWVGGYWHWSGVRYVWIPGHWERAPAGLAWKPPSYAQVDGRWVYEAGRWVPHARQR